MNASKQAILQLTKLGYRVTEPRKIIIEALDKSGSSLSIQALVKGVSVDEATVYRTIDLLLKEKLINEIKIIGEKDQYELAHGHHHHMICTDCGLVAHIPCESVQKPATLPEQFSVVKDHEVTFYGQCKKCV